MPIHTYLADITLLICVPFCFKYRYSSWSNISWRLCIFSSQILRPNRSHKALCRQWNPWFLFMDRTVVLGWPINLNFWASWIKKNLNFNCFMNEGFSCTLDVLLGGLGISKLQFLIKKTFSCNFFPIFGHINQCSWSGSSCFLAIRIRIHSSEAWIRIRLWIRIRVLLSSCKNNKKNLESYNFVTLFDFLSLKNNVNVPSKSNKQKKLC